MKKLVSMLLAFALILSVPLLASAEIDLSGMTWQELIDLRAAIMKEQLTRDEWQEVEVPQGVYKIGEDIPAGKWVVKCTTGTYAYISWGDRLHESGTEISWDAYIYDSDFVYNPKSKTYRDGEMTEMEIELKDGWYVIIESSPATFAPFTGKKPLGFK